MTDAVNEKSQKERKEIIARILEIQKNSWNSKERKGH